MCDTSWDGSWGLLLSCRAALPHGSPCLSFPAVQQGHKLPPSAPSSWDACSILLQKEGKKIIK